MRHITRDVFQSVNDSASALSCHLVMAV